MKTSMRGRERAAGASYLALVDTLHDSGIDVLVCRQESGAAVRADASSKLKGRAESATVVQHETRSVIMVIDTGGKGRSACSRNANIPDAHRDHAPAHP